MGRTLYAYADKLWEVSQRFVPTGEARQFTIQPGEYLFICHGAKGGERGTDRSHECIPCWNYGAAAYGVFTTNQEETMYAVVGGNGNDYDYPSNPNAGLGGFNGGGNGGTSYNGTDVTGAGGGGASDIRLSLDSTMIAQPQRDDVPSIYLELDYIEKKWNTNGCFNTGYNLNSNSKVVLNTWIGLASIYYNADSWVIPLGSRSSSGSTDEFFLAAKYDGTIRTGVRGPQNATTYTDSSTASYFGQIPIDTKFNLTIEHTRLSWIDEEGHTDSISNIPVRSNSNYPLYLYALNTGNTPDYTGSVGMRVYNCKIYENDVLIHEFVPVKRISDNTLGFYDVATADFRPITGTLYGKEKETYSTTMLSRILVAAGGGGNAVYSSYGKVGFTSGGGHRGSSLISKNYKQPDSGISPTQYDGYAFGQGMNGIQKTVGGLDKGSEGAGGGGGGWFGGFSVQNSVANSDIPGSGGSSYALTSTSWKPYGYTPTSHYYLTDTALIPCQSSVGQILICSRVWTLQDGDTIAIPFQGKETKIKMYPGTYDVRCWGGEGQQTLDGTDTNTRMYGGYSEGRLHLDDKHDMYAVVGGSGLFYGVERGFSPPDRYNPFAGFNGGAKLVKTDTANAMTWEKLCAGGATDLRLTMDDTPVSENAPSRSLMSRIIVAGGGGSIGKIAGGRGGGTTGEMCASNQGVTGGPGTQTESPSVPGHPECNGGFGYGGSGYQIANDRPGCGGGGWYGGSGSHANGRNENDIMGGNGGSGYVLTSDSYKPTGYIPTEEFYMTNGVTTLGGNTLTPNMTKIEIDVIEAFANKLVLYDNEGYKTYDEDLETWRVFSPTITPELIDEYGRFDIPNINGTLDEFEVVMDDPDNLLHGIEVSYFPLPQSIVFLIPSRYVVGRTVIDAVYDTSIYDFSTNVEIYDDQYHAYTITVDKLQDTDDVLKLYSIMLFSK